LKIFRLIIILSLFVSVSCSKKKAAVTATPLGLEYYPVTSGKYVIYDVDSVIYSDLPPDTISYKYRIKEKITDSFTDNLGQPAWRLERYIKKFDSTVSYNDMPWTMKEVWMINADREKIQVVEGNVRYTKLVFPLTESSSWNGNAQNTLPEWIYSVEYLNTKENINNNALEKVVLVEQKNFKTLISYQYYIEKYAVGAGLVYREIKDLYSNNIQPGIPLENRIEKGFTYKQELVSYGYE
jgi:hypothetical protein